MNERNSIRNLWHKAKECGEGAVLATVCEVKGSAYRRAGARMLLTQNGQSAGVINGGCLDADLHARAGVVPETNRAQLAVYNTTSSDWVWAVAA